MNAVSRGGALVAFRQRSFRFQWPADLATTGAFEMETLILGWYVLVETQSVILLTLFGSLQFIGTLIAPFLGVLGDRLGRRTMMLAMRGVFVVLAAAIMILDLTGLLSPAIVLFIAFLSGLLRPSDLVMRNALVADTMPPSSLPNALGLARTTQDFSRIFGALTGAGLFSVLGLGAAYAFVTATFLIGLALTAGVSRVRPAGEAGAPPPASYGQELKDGFSYVWRTPAVLAIMWLAFLANLTAFPFTHGLLPFVAREVYAIDENGLGHIISVFSLGAVTGSLIVAWTRGHSSAARMMVIGLVAWYLCLAVFAFTGAKLTGAAILYIIGIFHSLAMVSMSVSLLSMVEAPMRGRVMGVRILAIYGIPPGLLAAGFLIDAFGFTTMALIYIVVGLVFTALIAWKWRDAIWNGGRPGTQSTVSRA